jgi:2-polyprenyl-3-methyl-5-hydroxy-6-metoxy-1,4-benzoquinol methylase
MFKPGSYQNYGELISINSPYTVKPREDLFNLLPKLFNPKSILEFGCGNGNNLIFFGDKFNITSGELFGVDICKSIDIKKNEFSFNHSSIEKFLITNNKKFDLIIFSDVLEHLYNPWDILEKVSCHLTKQGIVLISVPNLQNIKYIDAITSGNFLYDNTGLFDQTHIRFFTLKSLLGYLEQQNFKIISNGWRPDISIQNIKDNLIGYLISQNNVNLKLTSCELTISYENIELYFGQQILIAAKINE